MKCDNCGIPEGTLTNPGYDVPVTRAAENSFRRDRTVTVFCCSRDCGIQAMAEAQYGKASSKWPFTLAQARTLYGRKVDATRRNKPGDGEHQPAARVPRHHRSGR